ncbi:succinate dehydrogenase, hydrophobic membrane anchor protein [Novispirillum sp. DQ9]|uniref:succinate dehydrogenase, hydrophobic membrane anchor protein n=1 Tax=Novispirillum sp. DQ9 TaxID=3398612 RepID=UPI003C7BF680
MSMRSPLGRARGLGSAKEGVHHWWSQRLTAVAMVPLIFWFVVAVIGNVGADYDAMRAWLGAPINATLLILLLVALFHHAQLGLQVVIEDYVHCHAVKTAGIIATKLLAVALGAYAVVSVLFVAIGG